VPRVCRRNNDLAQPFFCFWFRFQISGPHSIPLPCPSAGDSAATSLADSVLWEEERAGGRTEPSAARQSKEDWTFRLNIRFS